MMKSTDLRKGNDLAWTRRLFRARLGTVFSEPGSTSIDLRRSVFTNARFVQANLSEVDAVGAEATNTTFGAADFSGADFAEAKLHGSVFIGANLFGANFELAEGIDDARMTGAKFCNTQMPDGRRDDNCPP